MPLEDSLPKQSEKNTLFSSFKLGPIHLRNRSIRAAAFEGMSNHHLATDALINYHRSVAAGGIGMTTVAYAASDKTGLSFPHQLWLNEAAIPGLKTLTDTVHKEGAAASIQIGHCGNMAKPAIIGARPFAPSARFNLYGPTFPKAMNEADIQQIVKSFGDAVRNAQLAGFDAVEIHAGHGYLISQFLSPYTNHRKDQYGGSFENRTRFMKMVIAEVRKAAGDKTAVLVKINMRDGFKGGLDIEECIEVAKILEQQGVDALVLSGGFVSKAPMYVLRGAMPIKVLAHYMDNPLMKFFIRLLGKWMIKEEPFKETYFLEDALHFRAALKMPLVYVGGLLSREKIDEVLNKDFELVAIARALIKDPDFINKLLHKELAHSSCDTCNYCIARMYTVDAVCIQNEKVSSEIKEMLYG
jgi:2,4-dienoyl-CoA reductase-like NADH-dependent reductase (Old Yellow Enzyme family)